MALRDVTGAVDFSVLEAATGKDDAISEEVLGLFVEQAGMWSSLLDTPAWKDACHTLRGAAGGVGAGALAAACQCAEETGLAGDVARVRDELDAALADVAAYRHAIALRSLKR